MDVTNYIDFYRQVSRLELSPEADVVIISYLDAKMAVLLLLGHASIKVDIALLAGFGVSVEAADGVVIVINDRDSRFEYFHLTCYPRGCAPRMNHRSNKQVAMTTATTTTNLNTAKHE